MRFSSNEIEKRMLSLNFESSVLIDHSARSFRMTRFGCILGETDILIEEPARAVHEDEISGSRRSQRRYPGSFVQRF